MIKKAIYFIVITTLALLTIYMFPSLKFSFAPLKIYLCVIIFYILVAISLYCLIDPFNTNPLGKQFFMSYQFIVYQGALTAIIVPVEVYFSKTLSADTVIWSCIEIYVFLGLILNPIALLLWANKLITKIKKIPCIRTKDRLIETVAKLKPCDYLVLNAPYEAPSFTDPNNILQGEFIYLNYKPECYSQSKDSNKLSWNKTSNFPEDMNKTPSKNTITIIDNFMIKINEESFYTIPQINLEKAKLSLPNGAKIHKNFYYPKGNYQKPKDGDFRFSIEAIYTKQAISFLAEIGAGKLKVKPLLPFDFNTQDKIISLSAKPEDLKVNIISSYIKNNILYNMISSGIYIIIAIFFIDKLNLYI